MARETVAGETPASRATSTSRAFTLLDMGEVCFGEVCFGEVCFGEVCFDMGRV
jgi:hypothetical protein